MIGPLSGKSVGLTSPGTRKRAVRNQTNEGVLTGLLGNSERTHNRGLLCKDKGIVQISQVEILRALLGEVTHHDCPKGPSPWARHLSGLITGMGPKPYTHRRHSHHPSLRHTILHRNLGKTEELSTPFVNHRTHV